MPSSTSSSERIALWTALAGLGVLLGSLAIIRGCTATTEALLPDVFGMVRIKTANQGLARIATAPGPKAVFFGSSTVELGFAPEVFDDHLAAAGVDMTSYNLGIGNMNPSLQVVLARRMREVFEAEGDRVELMLVEFNPFQATRKRVAVNAPFFETVLAILSTPRTLWRDALEDPERAARLATIKYLRDGVAAQSITTGLGYAVEAIAENLGSGDENPRSPEFERVLEEREALAVELLSSIRKDLPEWRPPLAWHFFLRGAVPQPADLSPETLEQIGRLMANLAHPETMQEHLERRIRCCDIVDLHFDEGLVSDFIAMVHELASISDRIVVVLMPKNYDWVKNPPEALERQRRVLERIERETGVRVADFQHLPELDGAYFFDVSHLTLYEGQHRFSRLLAEHWAPRLSRD